MTELNTETSNKLAETIVADITSVNETLVAKQYEYNMNIEKINAKLIELNIDSAYVMTIIKCITIMNSNILFADIPEEDKLSSFTGAFMSIAILLHDAFKDKTREEMIEGISVLTNLLTIIELPTPEPEPTEPSRIILP